MNSLSKYSGRVLVDHVARLALPTRPDRTRQRKRIVLQDAASNIYAIGDVHGCLEQLLALESLIISDSHRFPDRQNIIVLLGDLIDRGPHSAQVIEHLLTAPPPGFTRYTLAGNHEEAMLSFLDRPVSNPLWLAVGGRETLVSYGAPPGPRAPGRGERKRIATLAKIMIPEEHLRFLQELPVALTAGRYLFVHGGLRANLPLEQQSDKDLQETRYVEGEPAEGVALTVVHGHTPGLVPASHGNRLALDIAPYATGRIAAARLCGPEVEFIISGSKPKGST